MVFGSSFSIENSSHIHILGFGEPCPRCGHTAELLSGEYETIGDVLKVVTGPTYTRPEIARLLELLTEAHEAGDIARVEERIRAEVPKFSTTLDFFRDNAWIAGWLSLLISFFTPLLARGEKEIIVNEQTVNEYITNIYSSTAPPEPSPVEPRRNPIRVGLPHEPGVPKPGRNDPCPCKSGKKWKKCHGNPAGGHRRGGR